MKKMSRRARPKKAVVAEEGGPMPKDAIVTERPSFRMGDFKLTIVLRGYEMDELERCASTALGRDIVKEILRGTFITSESVTIGAAVWTRYPLLSQLVAEIRTETP